MNEPRSVKRRGSFRADCRRCWLGLILAGATLAGATLAGAEPDVRRDLSVEAVAKVMPAVVNIGTETVVEVQDPIGDLFREFWGPYYRRHPATQSEYSLGSGVLIDSAGYVLTSEHVVRHATHIWVKLSEEGGGKEYKAVRLAGTARSDVALLKLETKAGERFHAVKFAADDDLLLGETVLALGNPFGLGGSVSRGILSSKSRRPPAENEPMDIADWLQTDAAINPGNSGGPLINLRGELIGINVAVYREGQGIGFAIPIRRVTEALSQIYSPELERFWFGARVRPGGASLTVATVAPGSPAAQAGLKAGDVILSVDGNAPHSFIEFNKHLMAVGDGRDISLVVQRGGARQSANVRLVRSQNVFNASLIKQKLGLSIQRLTGELAETLGLSTSEGLLIAGVERDSPAQAVGLQRGHVILGLDGQPADDVEAAAKILYAKQKGEKVPMEVLVQRRQGAFVMTQRVGVSVTVR